MICRIFASIQMQFREIRPIFDTAVDHGKAGFRPYSIDDHPLNGSNREAGPPSALATEKA
jgi:hypothetical protein